MRNRFSFFSCVRVFFYLWLLAGSSSLTLAATKTWTGNTNTDWSINTNWSDNTVPLATDDVVIPSAPANQPTIADGNIISVYSVEIKSGATLTIAEMGNLTVTAIKSGGITSSFFNYGTLNNRGKLTVNGLPVGSSFPFIFLNGRTGTVQNNGVIILGTTANVGAIGLENNGIFNNNMGGELSINGVSVGITMNSSTLTNTGKIIIGAVARITNGLYSLNGSTIQNNAEGEIKIDNATSGGIYHVRGTFTNFGKIILGSVAGIGLAGLQNDGNFINSMPGEIRIDNSTYSGLANGFGATFSNSAKIIIGATASVGDFGIRNLGSFINNDCSAFIHIVSNNIIFSSGVHSFLNSGTIIENASGNSNIVSNTGIVQNLNGGTFTIISGNQPLNGMATSPSTVGGNNGTIRISGLHPTTSYSLSYAAAGNVVNLSPDPVSDATGVITLSNLTSGDYTITLGGSCLPVNLNLTVTVPEIVPSLQFGEVIHPSGCTATDGSITFASMGFAGMSQLLTYRKNNLPITTTVTIAADGSFTLSNLGMGEYSDFSLATTSAVGSKKLALYGASDTNYWIGCTNTDWNTASNWSKLAVPIATDGVFITLASGNQPTINAATIAFAKSVGLQRGAVFTLMAGSQLTLNGSESYLGSPETAFFNEGFVQNNGQIIIGSTQSSGVYGIYNRGAFNNNSGGEINIDRSTKVGLYHEIGIFNNAAKITIGAIAPVGLYGLQIITDFNNNLGGEIRIDRSTNKGLYIVEGTFTNLAKIIIGSEGSVGTEGIYVYDTFINSGCSALINIVSDNIIYDTGRFNNTGTIIENATGISNIQRNDGVIQNLNGGTFNVLAGKPPLNTQISNPTACNSGDGSIKITGLRSSTAYSLNYTVGSTTVTLNPAPTSTANGEITIANLNEGNYTISLGGSCLPVNLTLSAVLTATSANQAPVINTTSDIVCTGTEITLSANCPENAGVRWSTGSTNRTLNVVMNSPTRLTYTVQCVFNSNCVSLISAPKTIVWKAFDLTFINVGQSQSATKTTPNPTKADWSNQFISSDAGPDLNFSTEANPTIFHIENLNKTAPRFWTIQVETCALGTDGSVTYDMLANPEVGVIRSYNTHENNAPYLMYANREGFTELYAQNHPAYGFYQDNGSGGNTYDAGLPKGLYKLSVRYWDQKGQGSIYPSTRQPAGNVLAYQEYWFRIQSQSGVGAGATRVSGLPFTVEKLAFAEVSPNPVSRVLRLKIADAKDQKVNVSLLDASGREFLQRSFVPQTNQHQEEFEVSELVNGLYFLRVNTEHKQATLKVVKVE